LEVGAGQNGYYNSTFEPGSRHFFRWRATGRNLSCSPKLGVYLHARDEPIFVLFDLLDQEPSTDKADLGLTGIGVEGALLTFGDEIRRAEYSPASDAVRRMSHLRCLWPASVGGKRRSAASLKKNPVGVRR